MSKLDKLNERRAQAPNPKTMNAAYAELVPIFLKGSQAEVQDLDPMIQGERVPILKGLVSQFPGSRVHNLGGQPVIEVKIS